MAVADKFVLQDSGVLPKQYELTEENADSSPMSAQTEQDNAAYAAVEKQRHDLEVLRARTAVVQDLYSMQGEILSRWIKNGAVGEPPTTLSWTQCEARANELIEAARNENLVSDELLLDQRSIDNIFKAAGIEMTSIPGVEPIDPQYQLEENKEDVNFTLIEPENVIPISEKIAGTKIGKVAEKTFTAIRKPKETLAEIKFNKQIEKILEADSVDYEEILTEIRSDVIVAKDVVTTAIRRMASDIELHGPHNLCELIAASSRISVLVGNEPEAVIFDVLRSLINQFKILEATQFLRELQITNREDCINALRALQETPMHPEKQKEVAEIMVDLGYIPSKIMESSELSTQTAIPQESDDALTNEQRIAGTDTIKNETVPSPVAKEAESEEWEAKVENLLDDQTEPVTVAGKGELKALGPIDGGEVENKLTNPLDNQTKKPEPSANPTHVTADNESKKDEIGVRELVKKELQEAPIEELRQTLDKLRADHSDFRNGIDDLAAGIIRDRVHDIVTSQNSTLTDVETLLNNLYDQELISARKRRDLLLDYSESYRERNPQKNQEVVSEPVKERVIEAQEAQEILSANSPLTEDEIRILREYVRYVQKNEPHKEKDVREMVADRVIAPILIEDLQSDEGHERLQSIYSQIREQIHNGLVSQPDVLSALERDLYGTVISVSYMTAKIRKRITLLKTLINNFSKGNETFINTLDEADKNKINRQVLLYGIVTSDNEDNLEIFVDKYTKSLSKDRKLSGEEERELEAVIRTKKELLRNKALNEVVKLCKDPKQDFSEKLFDLLKDRRDMSDLAKVICERLLEEKSYEAVAMFISTLREKQLFGDYDVFMLVNTLVSASVIEEIEARNITNIHDGFRNDLIRALYANGELSVEVSDSVRITTESLRYTEDEEVISRFIEACKEIGISF